MNDISGINLGQINPFRYRSYYFDTDLNLYLIGIRYYNPEIGRFITPDNSENIYEHIEESILSINLYSYCINNPINNIDLDGEFAITTAVLIGAGIGALIGSTIGAKKGYDKAKSKGVSKKQCWKYIVGYGLGGAIIGGALEDLLGMVLDTH